MTRITERRLEKVEARAKPEKRWITISNSTEKPDVFTYYDEETHKRVEVSEKEVEALEAREDIQIILLRYVDMPIPDNYKRQYGEKDNV